MKAFLFCAGLGTRLRPITNTIPKALVLVNGKSLVQRNIEYLNSFGINEFVINVHHFAEKIKKHLDENNYFGSHITISDETLELLETGGGLKKAAHFFKEDFLAMNVDILTDLNITKMMHYHNVNKPLATLAVTDRKSSRKLLFDTNKQLCGWMNLETEEKVISRKSTNQEMFAFSGIHIITPKFLKMMDRVDKHSIIDPYLKISAEHRILGYDHSGDFLMDIGKHETLKKAEQILV